MFENRPDEERLLTLSSFLPSVSPKAEQGRAGLQQAAENDWGRKRGLADTNLVAALGNLARPVTPSLCGQRYCGIGLPLHHKFF